MIDQMLSAGIQVFIAILFAVSCLHKLQDFDRFCEVAGSYLKGTIAANAVFVKVLACAVIIWEIGIVIAVITVQPAMIVGSLTCGILLIYAAGMGWNILRGNTLLDCGCSWGERTPVNSWHVVRNLFLVAFVSLLFLPVSSYAWSSFDVINTLALAMSAYVIYLAFDLIILNQVLLKR